MNEREWERRGRAQFEASFASNTTAEGLARETGIYGLSWFARQVIGDHYGEEVFQWRDVQFGVIWAGERAGEDIDPGVRWVALMQLALSQLDGIEARRKAEEQRG